MQAVTSKYDWPKEMRYKKILKNTAKIGPNFVPEVLKKIEGGVPYFRRYLNINGSQLANILHQPVVKRLCPDRLKTVKDKNRKFKKVLEFGFFRLFSFFSACEDCRRERARFPSVEFTALSDYDTNFPKQLSSFYDHKFVAKYPELMEHLDRDTPEEILLAMSYWPRIEADLMGWEDLPPHQKEKTALAVYAIATLSFTSWPVLTAYDLAPEIGEIYGLTEEQFKETILIDDGIDGGIDEGMDEGIDGGSDTPTEPGSEPGIWKTTLCEIAEAATAAQTELPNQEVALKLVGLVDTLQRVAVSYMESRTGAFDAVVETIISATEPLALLEEDLDRICKAWRAALESGATTIEEAELTVVTVTELLREVEHEEERFKKLKKELVNLPFGKGTPIQQLQQGKKRRELEAAISATEGNIESTREFIINMLLNPGQGEIPFHDLPPAKSELTIPNEIPPEETAGGEEVTATPITDSDIVEPVEASVAASPLVVEDAPPTGETAEETAGDDISDAVVDVEVFSVGEDEEQVESATDAGTEDLLIDLPKEQKREARGKGREPFKEEDEPAEDVEEIHSSAFLADKLLSESGFRGRIAENLITALVAEKNYPAAWVAASFTARDGDIPPVHASLLKTLSLTPYVRYSDGEIAVAIGDLISKSPNSIFYIPLNELATDHHVASFFVVAACLRPTLVAPQTEAVALLSPSNLKLARNTDGVFKLVKTVAEFGNHHQALDMHVLKNSMTLAAWRNELDRVIEDAGKWLDEAFEYRIKYIPAKRVWRAWLETNGFVQRAVALVASGDLSKLQQIKTELKRLSDSSKVDAEIEKTDDMLRPARNSSATSIDFQARTAIHNFTGEACALLRRFISIVENKPGGERSTFTNQLVNNLRDGFMKSLGEARSNLDAIIGRNRSLLGVAAQACLDAINDVALFFDPESPAVFTEPSPRHILYRQSLLTPGWETDNSWEPKLDEASPDVGQGRGVKAFLESLSKGSLSLEESFRHALGLKNHTITERIIEVLDAEGKADVAERLRPIRLASVADCRKNLRILIDATLKSAGEAFSYGCIEDPFYNEITGRLSSLQRGIEDITDFSPYDGEIKGITAKIAEMTKAQSTAIRLQFEKLGLSPDSNMYKIISRKLEAGDYAMASELTQRASEGEDIPDDDEKPDLFFDFSTRRFPLIEQYLAKNRNLATVVNALKSGLLQEEPGGRVDDGGRAAETFQAYQYAGRRGQFTTVEDVIAALAGLGFQVKALARRANTNYYDLQTDPINNRTICPIALYGSRANGNYRVIPIYGTPYENQILKEVVKAKEGHPIIVLVFGTFPEQKRRAFAKECREQAKTVLVIDTILAYAAATSRDMSTLSALFRLAIPWTFYKPYSEGGGAIPPEIFYGREAEKASIVGSGENTTAFIYGGRQLGKTALLNMIAKEFNNGANHVAVYIDLQARGIGKALPLDHIWADLTREFRAHKVLKENDIVGRQGRELDILQQWLEEDLSRRILLFLDEADLFLSEDGKDGFRIIGRLKNLKDSTQGRFRVVLSGLHNVQRSVHVKNDPLVQLGKATCIGPMLSTIERHDAGKLIEEPMRACGYYFESRELVWKVMAMVLYSPSLIQIFCSKIMNHINANLLAYNKQAVQAPPYIITERDINDAFRSQEVKDDILYRVFKTLNLDNRYELVANIIALDMLESQGRKKGYDALWIRQQGQKYWPKGFDQYTGSLDQFNVLLQEMVGLGVLLMKDNLYTFRTNSIAAMLGTEEEILDRLFKDRPDPPAYTPDIFRPAYDKATPIKCSPLSVTELGSIGNSDNGVFVVTGTAAGGINALAKSLQGFAKVVTFSDITKIAEFEARLTEELKKKARPGTTVIHFDSGCHWDDSWITFARKKVDKKTSENSFIKVLFEGGPANIEYIVQHDQALPLAESANLMRCLPWHREMVNVWSENNSTGPNHGARQENLALLVEQTGGWPELLYEFHEAERLAPGAWKGKLAEICSFEDKDRTNRLLEAYGIAKTSYAYVLSILAAFEEATPSEICEICDTCTEEEAAKGLRWAYLAGLATVDTGEMYCIDPVVGRLLRQAIPANLQ